MRNPFAIFLLVVTVATPGSSTAGNKTPPFTRAEVCELVDAALTAPWGGPEPGGLADYSCVQRNAIEGEYMLVDVSIVSVDGKETKPLRQGETCGRYKQYRHGRNEDVLFVGVGFTRIAPDRVWFGAGLGGIHFDARGKEDGTIGVACGAGNEGIIEKKFGRWSESRRTCR
jgi:hypothetical protein